MYISHSFIEIRSMSQYDSPDRSVRCGAELGAAAVPVDCVRRPRTVLQRLRPIDDVNTVKRDVTQATAERDEVAEVDFTVRAADEYVPVDVQLT